jgi:hypothetical protein
MKNLKTAAVIVLLAMNFTSIIVSIDYYKNLFDSFGSSYGYSPILGVQQVLFILSELFELSLCFIFLFGAGEVKDKSYKLLRFFFVMYYFFHLPLTIMSLIQYGGNSASWQLLYTIAMRLISLFCVIVFLVAKPERRVEKVDISDYELVAYTSTGHRFVHHLLDVLFFLPIWLPWIGLSNYGLDGPGFLANLVFYGGYFLYCFLSEAIFRQTFGKIWTNSCVVSNGISLSAGRVFVRTLCRYIPFDGLSFLWQGKWHDSVSSTAVVYVNTWEKVFEEESQSDNMVQNHG